MSIRIQATCALLLFASLASATDSSARFVRKLSLPTKQTVVVAEGDFEARSLGSYAVRVYSTEGAPSGDTTFFASGLIRPRDGTVEKIFLAKLDSTGQSSLVVTMRSAGSGGYLSADAFALTNNKVTLLASVSGLPAKGDPVAALRSALRRKNG